MVTALNTECEKVEWCLRYHERFGNTPDCEGCRKERVKEALEADGDDMDD